MTDLNAIIDKITYYIEGMPPPTLSDEQWKEVWEGVMVRLFARYVQQVEFKEKDHKVHIANAAATKVKLKALERLDYFKRKCHGQE